jgi:putative two-component system response regulator
MAARSVVREDELPVEATRRLVAAQVGTDSYPDEHAVGVAQCARRIAAQLRLGDATRRAVVEGALLHDVGKLLVDAAILAKPGPLTAHERRQVNMHPVEGERLVREAVNPRVVDVVRGHHERWDGAGYPEGLSADAIPIAARVVAVADAFLAMLEQRPYRTPLTKRAALDELKACAGSQFDPACVAALVRVIGAAA